MKKQCGLVALWALTAACVNVSTYSVPDAGGSVLYTSAPNAPLGAQIPVTLLLRRSDGSAVAQMPVQFSADGCSGGGPTATTDAQGLAQASLGCDISGEHPVRVAVRPNGTAVKLPLALSVVFYTAADGNAGVGMGAVLNAVALMPAPGNLPDPNYRGTVHFSSTDTHSVLPPDTALEVADHGFKDFAGGLTLRTPGTQTVQAHDSVSGALLGTQTFTIIDTTPHPPVNPNTVVTVHLTATAASTVVAGNSLPVVVSALDNFNNIVPTYTGTVRVITSDANALLPAYYTFTAADAGVRTLTSLVLNTPGTQTVTIFETEGSRTVTLSVQVAAGVGGHACMPYGDYGITEANRFTVVPALALDAADNPVLAWSDPQSGSYQVYVAAFNGSVWQSASPGSTSGSGISGLVGPSNPNGAAFPVVAAVDANGRINVAYTATINNGAPRVGLQYLVLNPNTQTWTGLGGSEALPGIWGAANQNSIYNGPVMALGAAGPGALWQDANGALQYLQWDGSNWSGLGGVSSLPLVSNSAAPVSWSLALDSLGRPVVAYATLIFGEYDVFLVRWDGSNWVGVSGSNQGGGVSNNPSVSWGVNVALDQNDTPFVAWLDDGGGSSVKQVYVATPQNGNWVGLEGSTSGYGISNAPSDGPIDYLFVRIDSTGAPWVSWRQAHNTGGTDLYMRRYLSGTWQQVFQSGTQGGITSLGGNNVADINFLLDRTDRPVFAYSIQGDTVHVCHWL